MGSSCGCSNLGILPGELDIDKEKKINKDFFVDFTSNNSEDGDKKSINKENYIKNELFNPFNDIDLLSTNNLSNINNNILLLNSGPFNNKNNQIKSDEINILINSDNYPKERINDLSRNLKNKNSKINGKEIIYSSESEFTIIKKIEKLDNEITEEMFNERPEDEYSSFIFDFINKLRTEPKNIAKEIENNKKYIFVGENNEIFFHKNRIKFYLNKGIEVFNETINILNDLKPMEKLIFNKNIVVEIPENEEVIKNLEYFKQKVKELNEDGKSISSFWREKTRDPEIAFLMMVVDDNNIKVGQKRNDLINPEMKFIGITSRTVNNNFICYITLAKK